jgi:hypothetical protein
MSFNRELARLESDLNYYKRDKEVMEQQFDRKRQEILNHIKRPGVNCEEMVKAMTTLNREYQTECDKMNQKINDAKQAIKDFKR